MKKVIFVCTGNTCRSPMAEAIARKLFSENNIDAQVISRGVAVFFESSAAEYASFAVKKYGVSLDKHKAKQISEDDLTEALLVLTMTDAHKDFLLADFSKYKDKIYTLKNYTDYSENDIDDPYGGSMDAYARCCEVIYDCLQRLILKI